MSDRTENPYPHQKGIWLLIAPDGRRWEGDSPLKVVGMEQKERIPASVRLDRIMAELKPTPWLCRVGLHRYRRAGVPTPHLSPYSLHRCLCGKESLR